MKSLRSKTLSPLRGGGREGSECCSAIANGFAIPRFGESRGENPTIINYFAPPHAERKSASIISRTGAESRGKPGGDRGTYVTRGQCHAWEFRDSVSVSSVHKESFPFAVLEGR